MQILFYFGKKLIIQSYKVVYIGLIQFYCQFKLSKVIMQS